MSPPDYDANLAPTPSLTREFEATPGYHETHVRAAFKACYSKAVEEIVKDIAPADFRCLFFSTKEDFFVRTSQRGSNMQGGTRTVAGAVAGTHSQKGSSPCLRSNFVGSLMVFEKVLNVQFIAVGFVDIWAEIPFAGVE